MRTVCYILERPYQMYKTILLQETTPDDSSEGKRERERTVSDEPVIGDSEL